MSRSMREGGAEVQPLHRFSRRETHAIASVVVPLIRVGETKNKGRGVFATADIAEGALIEECPIIVVPLAEVETINATVLRDYHFMWGGTGEESAICLGYGSLYNHSHTPSAMYVRRLDARIIAFHAVRDIREGEEITVSYNGGFGDRSPVWFEMADES